MFGMRLDQMKSNFFDRAKVVGAMDRATHQALLKFGAFVRQRSRTSIRQAPKVDSRTGLRLGPGRRKAGVPTHDAISDPGDPPFSHLGYVRHKIQFAFDDRGGPPNVLIGPEQFARGTVEALEKGGDVTVQIGPKRQTRTVTIRPRPFMQPAFDRELEKAPALWRDSMKE